MCRILDKSLKSCIFANFRGWGQKHIKTTAEYLRWYTFEKTIKAVDRFCQSSILDVWLVSKNTSEGLCTGCSTLLENQTLVDILQIEGYNHASLRKKLLMFIYLFIYLLINYIIHCKIERDNYQVIVRVPENYNRYRIY